MDKVAMLQQILAANPGDSFARYGLAMEYANSGKDEEAVAEFDRLLESDPNYAAGYFMAAQTLVRRGLTGQAKARLEEGIKCAERTGNRHAAQEMQGMLDELE